ncbi:MAG: hypothetical protein IJU19_07340 [Bacteroidales bacterium]|nr:hypothetical protein [Bacteroidales bacterium]
MRKSCVAACVVAVLLACACKRQVPPPEEAVELTVAFTDTVALPVQPASEATRVRIEARRKASQAAAKPVAKPKPAAEGKTLYVETEGAQGRVWGHVTMQGDTGSGTIHDWDENTLAVSVVRHGDELFAVDQNSRQYVFKLRK